MKGCAYEERWEPMTAGRANHVYCELKPKPGLSVGSDVISSRSVRRRVNGWWCVESRDGSMMLESAFARLVPRNRYDEENESPHFVK